MSRLMQLSNLYIRGAIATQTMPGLTESEVRRINDIVIQIENDQSIAPDRFMFIQQLGATIKSDYKSDTLTALQEFRIAIWRATVYLLHHTSYSYNCSLCGATEYQTCADTPKAFDRQYKICPKCEESFLEVDNKLVRISTIKRTQGYTIIDERGKILKLDLTKDELDEILKSPIIPIHGPRKVEDPEKILNDDVQRSKWYVTWIWNYFRQILNENIIKTHNKHVVEISGPADKLAFEIIVNELKKIKHKFSYDEGIIIGLTDKLMISAEVLASEPIFSQMLAALREEFKQYNVDITIGKYVISINPIGEIPTVSTTIESEEPVVVLSFSRPATDNDNHEGTWGDIVESRSAAGPIYDGKIDDLISDDALTVARRSLKDDNARKVFDILSQTGEEWKRFSASFGLQQAKKTHLAEYLGVPTKKIEAYKHQIAVQCMVSGIK